MQIWQAYNNHQIWCRSIYKPNKNLAPNFGAFNTILWISMLGGCLKNCGIKGTPPIPSMEKKLKRVFERFPFIHRHTLTISPSHINISYCHITSTAFCDSEKQTENASQEAVRRARHQTCSIWRILPQEILVKGSLVKGSRSSGRLWSSQAPTHLKMEGRDPSRPREINVDQAGPE